MFENILKVILDEKGNKIFVTYDWVGYNKEGKEVSNDYHYFYDSENSYKISNPFYLLTPEGVKLFSEDSPEIWTNTFEGQLRIYKETESGTFYLVEMPHYQTMGIPVITKGTFDECYAEWEKRTEFVQK